MPAVPLLIAGLSRSASASGVGGSIGRRRLGARRMRGIFRFFRGLVRILGHRLRIWGEFAGGERPALRRAFRMLVCRQKTAGRTPMTTTKFTRRTVLAGLAATPLAGVARAQADWPNRNIRVIVPYPPAGGADTTARILYAKVGNMLGQQFVIENRGGAGGTIGEAVVAKADPDGYTHHARRHRILRELLALSQSAVRLRQGLRSGGAGVAGAEHPGGDAVGAGKHHRRRHRLRQGVARRHQHGFVRQRHAAASRLEMFRHAPASKSTTCPIAAAAPRSTDVMSGQVKFFFSNGSSVVGLIKGGKVKAIAHTGKGRLDSLPDIPPVSDTMPGFEAYEWNGVFAPHGTPKPIVAKLNASINQALGSPEVSARFKQLNIVTRADHAGRISRLRRGADEVVEQGGQGRRD